MRINKGELGDLSQHRATYFFLDDEFALPLRELCTGADGSPATFCTSGRLSDQRTHELMALIEVSREPQDGVATHELAPAGVLL